MDTNEHKCMFSVFSWLPSDGPPHSLNRICPPKKVPPPSFQSPGRDTGKPKQYKIGTISNFIEINTKIHTISYNQFAA